MEAQQKTKMYRTSMLARKVSKANKAIPHIGEGHVLEIAPNTPSVVPCCVGGTKGCGERWYAISSDIQSGLLRATSVVDVAPLSSDEFPRRTQMFTRPGPAMRALVAATTESEVRKVLDDPQFGALKDRIAASLTVKPLASPVTKKPRSSRVRKQHQIFTTPGPFSKSRPRVEISSSESESDQDQDTTNGGDALLGRFPCSVCDSTFANKKGATSHFGRVHKKVKLTHPEQTDPPPSDNSSSESEPDQDKGTTNGALLGRFSCSACDETFTSKKGAATHFGKMHKIVKLPHSEQTPAAVDFEETARFVSATVARLLPTHHGVSVEEHTKLADVGLARQAKLLAAHQVVQKEQRDLFMAQVAAQAQSAQDQAAAQAQAAQDERNRSQNIMCRVQLATIDAHKHTVSQMAMSANPNLARTVPGTATPSPRSANEILQEHDADLTIDLLAGFPGMVDGVLAGILTTGARLVVMKALAQATAALAKSAPE
jgi:hypothetical protein